LAKKGLDRSGPFLFLASKTPIDIAQIFADLPRVVVKAFSDFCVTAQARLLRNLVKSRGDAPIVG
jgi:hypothetical protein